MPSDFTFVKLPIVPVPITRSNGVRNKDKMPDWRFQSGIFSFQLQGLFRCLLVTGTHGLDVEVDDLLAFLAEDVSDSLLHLLHRDA